MSRSVAAVYDCMLYLQAAMSARGPAARCLEAAEAGHVRLFASGAVLAEVADVLGRPALRRRRAHLTTAFITAFVERVRQTAIVVDPVPERFTYSRDPDDEPYLNLVLASRAAYLVSRDRDLLDLQRPESEAGQKLRGLVAGLTILDPVEFLGLLPALPDEVP